MGLDVHTQCIVGPIIWRHSRARLCRQGATKLTARHVRTRTLCTPLPPPLSRPYSVQPSTKAISVPIAKSNTFAAAINSLKVLDASCTALDHQLDAPPDLFDIFAGGELQANSVTRPERLRYVCLIRHVSGPCSCRIHFSFPPHQIVIPYLYIAN